MTDRSDDPTNMPRRSDVVGPPGPTGAHGWRGAIDDLLRSPSDFVARGATGTSRRLVPTLVVAVACLVAYGLAAGFYHGGMQPLVSAIKAPLLVLGSLVLCLPSLFVFGALAGVDWTGRRFATVAAGLLGIACLLLAALLPAQWLFSVSSRSLRFVVVLHGLFWLVALVHAHRFLRRAVGLGGISLFAWFVLLFLVSLQVTTQLRPVLTPGNGLLEQGKLSFVEQWGELGSKGE